MKRIIHRYLPIICCILLLVSCGKKTTPIEIPADNGTPFIQRNNNQPNFTDDELVARSFEEYSPLDALGRCGPATACVSIDTMPTEERGSIGQVKPSGWQTIKYDHVDGKYLYNRCHLIGYQLTGENANPNNLITGTRYMNTEGMLPFENEIADYVKETNNHVLYRVTPIFEGDNLLASGVILEAKSVEDNGGGVCFHVYCYNSQPGVTIDYATGKSWLSGNSQTQSTTNNPSTDKDVSCVLNRNTKKFHLSTCHLAEDIRPANREEYIGTRDTVIQAGYSPCKTCNP